MSTPSISQSAQLSFRKKIASYISSHSVFTGVFTVFIAIIAFQVASQNSSFKSHEFYFPFYMTLATFFAYIKIFLMAYNNIEDSVSNSRWVTFLVSGSFFAGQIWLLFASLNSLSINSYPNEFFQYSLFAFVLYILTLIIGQIRKLTRYSIISCFSLLVSTIMVDRLFFNGDILFLQTVTFIYLVSEVFLSFLTAREYFSN